MYKKVSTDLNFVKREEAVLALWRELNLARKMRELNPDGPVFTIYDGPPTANGKPHIGHVLTRSVKDIFPRFHRMKGSQVEFIAGWDTHGLPVELEVERQLGIDGKEQIETYGVEPFIRKCKESVWTYKDEWEQMSERVGYTGDMEHPYVTYENNYIETEWWILKQMWEKDLLYKGYKIVPYCPRCGTALSSHEVAQGYKDVKETSAFVRFRVTGEPDTYFAAWTTTPWTLPSNVALCVNPTAAYALIEVREPVHGGHDGGHDDGHDRGHGCGCAHDHGTDSARGAAGGAKTRTVRVRYYMAAELAESLFGADYTVLRTMPGRELTGMTYEPLFPYAVDIVRASGKRAFVVTADNYVTMTDGTGIVHIAPAFGEDDARVGRQEDLAFVQLVKDDGTMPAEVTDFAGQFCKDADPGLLAKLAADGLLIRTMKFEHSYPFCWRCDTPLIYYARHSWFIRMTAVRDRLLANNQAVNWLPANIRDGRFGNFLENVVDWGLSRERYWGTPLPVWECGGCGHRHLVGSIEELKAMSDDCPEDIELHKPYIDAVHLRCPSCGKPMTRVPEVIDCWFDSGAMPFAQYHYPFENQERFRRHFAADFISEALDQTRGWFYSLMAISTALDFPAPYKNVIVMGLVQDKDGIKMSKHKGNVVNPWDALNTYGADAIRWYFYTNSQPWLPSRYADDAVREGQNKFMGTLWNTYAFYVMYAELDGFNPFEHQFIPEQLPVVDRWLLSRLNTLIREVDQGLRFFDMFAAGRKLNDFVDDLSNWYVRRNRQRYWQPGMEADKINAYMTLFTALNTVIHLAAPFVPFITEAIYQNLVGSVCPDAAPSIHLNPYPVADAASIDVALEADMELARSLVVLGRAARNASGIKNRQPLSRMLVKAPRALPEAYTAIMTEELNVKALSYVEDGSALQDYRFKPQLRVLGRLLGKHLPTVTRALAELDGQAAMQALKTTGSISVSADGETWQLTEDQLIIETGQAEGFAAQSDGELLVALDLKLTPELIEAGFVREIVSKLQTMRKDEQFEVSDRIGVRYCGSERIEQIFSQYGTVIAEEVLAVSVERAELSDADSRAWQLNGEPCRLSVSICSHGSAI